MTTLTLQIKGTWICNVTQPNLFLS